MHRLTQLIFSLVCGCIHQPKFYFEWMDASADPIFFELVDTSADPKTIELADEDTKAASTDPKAIVC